MTRVKQVDWADSNKELLKAAVRAVINKEMTFRCPLFNSVCLLQPLHILKGVEYRPFEYRGFKYYVSRGYIPQWKNSMWTLGLIVRTEGRDRWKIITMMHDDMHTFIDFSIEGEYTKMKVIQYNGAETP